MTPDLPPDVPALIRQCAPHVAVQTLKPLIRVESAKRPHAIGYKVVAGNGTVYRLTQQPRNSAEAQQWARWFIANGYRFDAGIAQVNTVNFASTGLTPETMFDPCASIRAGAQVLTDCYTRAYARYRNEQTALRAALSCYQSGNFRTGFATGYVSKVLTAAGVSEQPAAPPAGAPPLQQVGGAVRRPAAVIAVPQNIHAVPSEIPGFGSALPASDAVSPGAFTPELSPTDALPATPAAASGGEIPPELLRSLL
ncbi:MAG: lytic transglycosylase domain-containing protein [Pseudomonadota bacterium]|nr:lytic transglycosylase domain-containing protein [Pseudomonadota bacterium]